MRRVLTALAALSLAAVLIPQSAEAQSSGRPGGQQGREQSPDQGASQRSREVRIAPLSRRANAGPCPYVKVLYDAARYEEFKDGRQNAASVGFTGEITEIAPDGTTATVLPGGLNWPLDLTVGDDGRLYVADGTFFYAAQPDGSLQTVGMLFSPGYPGFVRGVVSSGPGEFVVTTSGGQLARYRPAAGDTEVLADGYDQLYGVALGSAGVVFAEFGTGRVLSWRSGRVETLATGLHGPVGIAVDDGGAPLVAESGAGRVVRLTGSSVDTIDVVVADLHRPQGICVHDRVLYIVDAGAGEVLRVDPGTTAPQTIASGLPIGPPPGVVPKPLKGMPPFSGPQGPFAGIAAAPDGTLYISADGDGSVLALRLERERR